MNKRLYSESVNMLVNRHGDVTEHFSNLLFSGKALVVNRMIIFLQKLWDDVTLYSKNICDCSPLFSTRYIVSQPIYYENG